MRVVICRANGVAPEPRVEKTTRTLQKGGHIVQILGWDRQGNLPRKEEKDGMNIQRLVIRSNHPTGLMNVFPLIFWTVRLFVWLFRQRKTYDLIHACDLDTVLPALWCKRLLGKQVVYDIYDFYADMLRKTPGWVARWVRKIELRAIDRADWVILADDSRVQQIAGSHPQRLEVIYNAPEEVDIPLLPRENTGLRLVYFGNLQVERGLLQLLAVLARHDEWRLELGGSGPDEEQILAEAGKLANVTWHGVLAYEQVLFYSQQADALIATYDPAIPNHRYSSPNKVFEAMMLAKPVLVARDSNADCLVERAGCGLVVPYGDQAALEGALAQLAGDGALRTRLGQQGRMAFEHEYSWEKMSGRLLNLYATLESKGGAE